ncbi:MAG: hypothetical protein FWE67_07310 [Planctomycetaceae bacterium]|nr:hypothetical protein [Planctomycetaceae bacterium]
MTLISNLWTIIWKAPQIIGIIRAIIDITGSETFQKILEFIQDILKLEPLPPNPDKESEPDKQRLLERLKKRIGLSMLKMDEGDYMVFQDFQTMKNSDIQQA